MGVQMRQLFGELDADGSGKVDQEEFMTSMSLPKMQHFLKAIDLVPQDTKALFNLVDVDNEGEIDADKLMIACSRLQGNAKALDLAIVMRGMEEMRCEQNQYCEQILAQLQKTETPRKVKFPANE